MILLTGGLSLAPIIITTVGLGIIVGGTFYIKNIGNRLYESTELMNMYLNGNEETGKIVKTKGYMHGGLTVAFAGASKLAKPVSNAFANTKLGQGFLNLKPIVSVRELGHNVSKICGRYLMDGFANSKYGIISALDLLNELSPKYIGILCDFLAEYGTSGAVIIEDIEQNKRTEDVNDVLDNIGQQKTYREIINETNIVNLSEKQGNQMGDIDVVTDRFIIEVKNSSNSVTSASQFDNYINPTNANFFNFGNKQVILYVREGGVNYNKQIFIDIQNKGVIIVDSLEKLIEVITK